METENTTITANEDVVETANELRQTMGAVKLSFSWLGTQRKLSDVQTKQAADTFHAATDLVTASKRLIDTKNATYRTLTAIKSQAGGYWRSMTLPYPQDGIRLMKQSDMPAFEEKMREFKEQLAAAAANLQLEYEAIKVSAREKLGDLFNFDDYPTTLDGIFEIRWEYPPVEPPNYLMTFNPELYAQEQTRIQQRFETAVTMAEDAFAEQLNNMLEHLIDRLTDKPNGERKILHNSAVKNLVDFYNNFRQMNVRSNAELNRLIQRASDLVGGVSPDNLRQHKNIRETLAAQMSEIKTSLDTMVINAPRRRIAAMSN